MKKEQYTIDTIIQTFLNMWPSHMLTATAMLYASNDQRMRFADAHRKGDFCTMGLLTSEIINEYLTGLATDALTAFTTREPMKVTAEMPVHVIAYLSTAIGATPHADQYGNHKLIPHVDKQEFNSCGKLLQYKRH